MKSHKNKITAGVIIAVILTFAFLYGGNAPRIEESVTTGRSEKTTRSEFEGEENTAGNITFNEEKERQSEDEAHGNLPEKPAVAEQFAEGTQVSSEVQEMSESVPSSAEENEFKGDVLSSAEGEKSNGEYYDEQEMVINEAANNVRYTEKTVSPNRSDGIEPENTAVAEKELTCTLSVRCDTILSNMKMLDSDKAEIVPQDGVIFAEKSVVFYEGESVFNLLMREMKRNKIHMEFENTPIYESAYIEGIANIYEFDCGELSGWMYKVNDRFPDYGCSQYQLKEGDRVEWVYTCDLGRDVGGSYSARNGN